MSRPAVSVLALVLCAALVLTISNGIRSSFGLFLTPMSLDIGVSRETFALAIAIQGLVWGSASRSSARLPTVTGRYRLSCWGS